MALFESTEENWLSALRMNTFEKQMKDVTVNANLMYLYQLTQEMDVAKQIYKSKKYTDPDFPILETNWRAGYKVLLNKVNAESKSQLQQSSEELGGLFQSDINNPEKDNLAGILKNKKHLKNTEESKEECKEDSDKYQDRSDPSSFNSNSNKTEFSSSEKLREYQPFSIKT